MEKIKVIYDRACDGFNPGDSALYEEAQASKVVKSGDAHYATPPKSKSRKKEDT